jgi:hypothetical protein
MSTVESVAKIFQEQILNKIQVRLVEEGCNEKKVEKVFKEFSYSAPNVYTPKPKPYKVDHKGNDVIIVLDYGEKSHAIFGDFAKIYKTFKDDFLKPSSFMRFNKNLAFGAGWILTDKDKLSELKKMLKEHGIDYRELSRTSYEKEIKKNKGTDQEPVEPEEEEDLVDSEEEGSSEDKPKKKPTKGKEKVEPKKPVKKEDLVDSEEEGSSEDKPKKKPTKGKEKIEPKKPVKKEDLVDSEEEGSSEDKPKKKPTKGKEKVEPKKPVKKGGKPTKNDWGNLEEPITGFIFKVLPVGDGPKGKPVVIGVQDKKADKKKNRGLESVLSLSEKDIQTCAEYKWSHLTQKIIDEIKEEGSKKSKVLASSLQNIIDKDNDSDSDEEGPEDGDESDEDVKSVNEESDEEEEPSVYYNISVPCNSEEPEEEDFEIDIPCKFASKEVFQKVKKTLKDEESEDFEELTKKLNKWLKNVEDSPFVVDTPTIGDKLTGKEDEEFLVFKK